MQRSERQSLSVQKWVDNRLRGTLVLPTGFGKTKVGVLAAQRFQKGNPSHKILIVVPSDPIKLQWEEELALYKIKADVITMFMASKHEYQCTMLVLDEFNCRD